MANRWTEEQLAAISGREPSILVSAAAGSGKTAVLVERIIRLITDEEHPVDIDRLLVVTFTNAAAAEMRERITAAIAEKLEENPSSENLARQMVLAAKASITTIHSFCLEMLRSNFNLAGIDPNFRIADATEESLLRLEALDEVMDEMYEDDEFGETFSVLLENYSGVKNRSEFDELIQKIYSFAMSLPNPEKWLRDSAEKFSGHEGGFASSALAMNILQLAGEIISEMLGQYDEMIRKAEADDGGENLSLFLRLERECINNFFQMRDYAEAREWAQSMTFARFPTAPKKSCPQYREYIKEMRADVKKNFEKKVLGDLFELSCEEQERTERILYPQMRCLSELVYRLMRRFDEKKDDLGLLTFNDLEHGCYHLLVDADGQPTELAVSTGKKYEEILIDEYQDTSRLQEAIFEAIHADNRLFMVGDMKQSIYRFRNTDPLLFGSKKEKFSLDAGERERKIILSKNFRSRKEILFGINDIFEKLMSVGAGEIDYNEEEKLYPGAEYPECPHPVQTDLQLHVIEEAAGGEFADTVDDANAEPPADVMESEARLTASLIAELLSKEVQVLTKGGYRTITYRDICILLRTTKDWAEVFLKTLSECGIPAYSEKGGGFLQSAEVETMLSLLKIIDNPYQDIPLLSVLRSQIVGLSTNDLAQIRLANRRGDFFEALCSCARAEGELPERLRAFLMKLDEFREQAQYLSLYELIWMLYRETGFYDAQGTLTNGLLRQSNLRLLAIRAKEYEKTSFCGLYQFIRFIDHFHSAGGDYDSARSIGEEQDVVRIMSIHKSKGLEFPVVFLCGAGKQMNRRDLKKNVLIHPELGYGPKFIDNDLRITYPTAIRTVVKRRIEQEMISEEMRILYVALTRAREKLFVVGSVKNADKQLYSLGMKTRAGEKILSPYVLSAHTYLDWFFLALLSHKNCAILRRSIDYPLKMSKSDSKWAALVHSKSDIGMQQNDKTDMQQTDGNDSKKTERILSLIRYQYPYRCDETLPTKITVSELKNKKLRDENSQDIYLYPRPKFLQETHGARLTGAALGTAFHTAMQRMNLQNAAQGNVEQEIFRLHQSGYLTQQEADCIDSGKIERFFQTEIGRLILHADRVEREVMFGIHIPAREAESSYEGSEQIMLQGVIDCVIICSGEITILDYKTEHVISEQKIAEKYAVQLEYYARAAQLLYRLPVTKRIIYLFETEKILYLN